MSYDLEPTVGRFYQRVDDEQVFKVIGIDEENHLIELQHADGEVEEISGDAWLEIDLETVSEPEDWVRHDDEEDEDEADEESDEDDDDDEDEEEDEDDDDYAYDDRGE